MGPPYVAGMDTPIPDRADRPETDAERAARKAEEGRLCDEAEADFIQNGGIPADEVHAWIRSLGTPNPLPRPKPRKDDAWCRYVEAKAREDAEAL